MDLLDFDWNLDDLGSSIAFLDDYVVDQHGNVYNSAGDLFREAADTSSWFDSLTLPSWLKGGLKNVVSGVGNFIKSDTGRLSLAGLAGLASAAGARPAYGGGTTQAYQGPAPLKREIVQGKYGPIAQYAAQGGLMHAYAHGGHVNMEDGGFVMTKRAVDGAGGPRGLAALVPGARPIRGPGTGTSDSIPATIHGARGQTPARVSNGEAYVPRATVQRMGGAQQMYNLMNNLQRRG